MKPAILTAAIAAALIATGCASPHVVQAVNVDDSAFSCNRLRFEMNEADRFREEAQAEKGVTGANVAAVLFFWPAMIGTYANANEAIAAADTRKVHLLNLFNQKKCTEQAAASAPAGRLGAADASNQVRVLKKQHDDRKIDADAFKKRRQDIADRVY